MANAKPVHSKPEADEAKEAPKVDPRRPSLAPEISGNDKPKKVTKIGDTVIEDY